MKNWGYHYRNWELSADGRYYTVRGEPLRPTRFNNGDRVVVLCFGHGLFTEFRYEEGMPKEHDEEMYNPYNKREIE